MEKEKDLQYAGLFGNNPNISLDERVRVINEINKTGSLTFMIEKNEEGWMAQCNEISGIITGGTNPKPSNVEIESQIREAIYAAFNVKVTEDTESPYFGYKDIAIESQSLTDKRS